MIKYLAKFLFLIGISHSALAQQNPTLYEKIQAYHESRPIEQLYLSFDKPYYTVGDTVYFKSFLLNGVQQLDTLSEKLYVELFNEKASIIERKVIALNSGLGYGDFSLSKTMNEGTYTIRAYTNWQQNFGPDYFFQKTLFIGNYTKQPWLLSTGYTLDNVNQENVLALSIKITSLTNEVTGLRDMEMVLKKDNRQIARANLQTSAEGMLKEKFILPTLEPKGDYSLQITDKKDKSKTSSMPLVLTTYQDVDLQFMPEGGYMINNQQAKVAFKAVGNDGLGAIINGKIVNSHNEQVARLSVLHNGMGSFFLTPQPGEKYVAIYQYQGREMHTELPQAAKEGISLHIDPFAKPDSIAVVIHASEAFGGANYQLVAQSTDKLLFSLKLNLQQGFVNLKMAKTEFPHGIIHFTLFSPDERPLNERQAFINFPKSIELNVDRNSFVYTDSGKVSVRIAARDEAGVPLRGSFAVSVTDNSQISNRHEQANIISHFLLQSNLKGYIENPSWYFEDTSLVHRMALDHLLLTQGWIGYNWPELLKKPTAALFKVEKLGILHGNIRGILRKPMPGIDLTLLSLGKNIFIDHTTSDKDGRFIFSDLPLTDTASYLIKIRKPNGKSSGATIDVDLFSPSLQIPEIKRSFPWYINTDTAMLNFFKNGIKRIEINEKAVHIATGTLLKEVEIIGFKENILTNETWDANFIKKIGEEELKAKSRKSVYELMQESYPGFKLSRYWQTCGTGVQLHAYEDFVIGTQLVSWVRIDNVVSTPDVTKQFFTYILAEDIKEIGIYKGCSTYYLDITTRSGRGPWVDRPIGVYVYRPLPWHIPKEFYKPKYGIDNPVKANNLQATRFWDANFVTDENGMGIISFYRSGPKGGYTLKIEGADLQGRLGYLLETLP